MRTAINKKRIVLYAVCAFFFCLAGVFQAVDSSLPDFWHALFALLAHTILISLVVAWGISLIHRMVRKDLRAYFLTVAVLILFFLVVRMIRYGLTKDTDVYSADDFACGVQHREQKGQTSRKSVVFLIFACRDIASFDINKRHTRMGVRFEL